MCDGLEVVLEFRLSPLQSSSDYHGFRPPYCGL